MIFGASCFRALILESKPIVRFPSGLDALRRSVCIAAMKLNALLLAAVCAATVIFSGCVRTLDGRREAGNPLVKANLVRVYERPVKECWVAAKDVLSANGAIFSEDIMQSTVSARVDTRTIRVKVESIDPKMTRVTVQTRTRMGNSDLDLGGEIDKQIALRLTTGQTTTTQPTVVR